MTDAAVFFEVMKLVALGIIAGTLFECLNMLRSINRAAWRRRDD